MRMLRRWVCIAGLVMSAWAPVWADEQAPLDERIRVLSWNVSGDAFASEPQAFQSLSLWADPDVVLLDEVDPAAARDGLASALVVIQRETKLRQGLSNAEVTELLRLLRILFDNAEELDQLSYHIEL